MKHIASTTLRRTGPRRPLPRLRGRDREGEFTEQSSPAAPSPPLPRKRGREPAVPAAIAVPPMQGLEGSWLWSVIVLQFISTGSSRGCDLHATRRGTTEAVGPVHVLHERLWMHVAAGRDGPDHVGDCEHRGVVRLAVERRAEAVVAELRACRLDRIIDPRQRAGFTR